MADRARADYARQVLAFHYVWYGTPFGPAGQWLAWPGGYDARYNPDLVYYGKRMVDSPDYPLDGPYDSLDPVVIKRQLRELQSARIGGSIVSWWGVGDYSDRVLDALVEAAPTTGLKVTLYYETPMVERRRGDRAAVDLIHDDMRSVLGRHAASDSWLKVEGRPVVVIYVAHTQPLAVWREVKARLKAEGFDAFFLGDTFDLQALPVMDGLHTYNPVGRLVRGEDVGALYRQVSAGAHAQGKLFAATVLPGFDDRKIRTPGTYLARENGGCYNRTWQMALAAEPDWILVTSYNEWHEGSEVEPSLEYGTDYLWQTAQFAKGYGA